MDERLNDLIALLDTVEAEQARRMRVAWEMEDAGRRRDAWARELTQQWLSEHLPLPIEGLHMRPDGDFRSNTHIKREIHGQLALAYEIRAAIDDDPEIVELWQEFGIPVAMVLDWGEVVLLRPDEHEI